MIIVNIVDIHEIDKMIVVEFPDMSDISCNSKND